LIRTNSSASGQRIRRRTMSTIRRLVRTNPCQCSGALDQSASLVLWRLV
jgi:hypothetical protein